MAATVPDLNDIMKKWAWTAYRLTKNYSGFAITEVDMDVIWDKVKIISDEPEYFNRAFTKDPVPQVLYNSSFENKSDHVQNHNFQTSEQAKYSATTTLKKGFTRGNSGFMKLTVPIEVVKSTSVFGKKTVINEDGMTTEKAKTWAVNTQIKAMPHKKTCVELLVVEKRFKCDFKMKVRLSGNIRVNINHATSGATLMVVHNDLVTVLKDIKETKPQLLKSVTFEPKKAVWSVEGHTEFLYGVEQKTSVWYEKLSETKGDEGDDEVDADEDEEEGENGEEEEEYNRKEEEDDDNDDDKDDDSERAKESNKQQLMPTTLKHLPHSNRRYLGKSFGIHDQSSSKSGT